VIKIIGETKIVSADNRGTYINATESGEQLNVVALGKVDVAATDSVELRAQIVVINPGSEFIVNSDMRARGKVTVVDGGDSLIIHGTSAEGITLENTITDQDIIFKVYHNFTSTEVLRLTGEDASLRMAGPNAVEFRNIDNSISATDDNELSVKSPTIKLDASGDGSGTMELTAWN